MQRILKSIKNIQDADVRLQLRDEYEKLRRERQKIESRDSMDETYRRLRYVRYADDFLIGVIGSKAECVKIKSDITKYMEENLKLELSQEKTYVTHKSPRNFLASMFQSVSLMLSSGTRTMCQPVITTVR